MSTANAKTAASNLSEAFYVTPKRDCPHVGELVAELNKDSFPGRDEVKVPSCEVCKDTSENWICLKTHKILCSRYKNGHMAAYADSRDDQVIAASLIDLSVWCFKCDSYITDLRLSPILHHIHDLKWGGEQ